LGEFFYGTVLTAKQRLVIKQNSSLGEQMVAQPLNPSTTRPVRKPRVDAEANNCVDTLP
jgi:hypothetical protein